MQNVEVNMDYIRVSFSAVEIVAQPYDTHVTVDWSETDRTAIFVFRGSITEQDWLQALPFCWSYP